MNQERIYSEGAMQAPLPMWLLLERWPGPEGSVTKRTNPFSRHFGLYMGCLAGKTSFYGEVLSSRREQMSNRQWA
jgi:hypothetical protein